VTIEPKPETHGKGAGFYAAIVLGVLALYVLSSGPMLATFNGSNWLAIYIPLFLLSSISPTFAEWFYGYLSWWIPPEV
jgi:hypothetical protein